MEGASGQGIKIQTFKEVLTSPSTDVEREEEDQKSTRVRELPQQFMARQDPSKRQMTTSTPNLTFFRLSGQPWGVGLVSRPSSSSSIQPRVGPATVAPPGKRIRPMVVRFHLTQPGGQVNPNQITCFNRQEPGPKLNLAGQEIGVLSKGMVYAESGETLAQEAREGQVIYRRAEGDVSPTDQVVQGKMLLFSHLVHVLIDTGSRYSFISLCIAEKLGLKMTFGDKRLSLETPFGSKKFPFRICKCCVVMVDNQELMVDLVVLDIQGFDVILRMDWLAKYHASVDCYAKTVTFHMPGNLPFTFTGSRKPQRPFQKLNKTSGENGIGLLAVSVESSITADSIPVVREFEDIFLPGLPPKRVIDFSIGLLPGISPISVTPYRMAPVEKKELKIQLQELTSLGIIRPSFSPWVLQFYL